MSTRITSATGICLTVTLLALGSGRDAGAAPVRGLVHFPEDIQSLPHHTTYWRISNGILPIGPALHDPRTEAMVVLYPQETVTGAQVAAAEEEEKRGKPKVDVRIAGVRLNPPVVVIPPEATVVFHNDDRVEEKLLISCVGAAGSPPRQVLAPGAAASVTFEKPGDCSLRSPDIAHLAGTVLVVEHGFHGRVDAAGTFQFEAPEGHYQAKLFFHGAWVASHPVDVSPDGVRIEFRVAAHVGHGGGKPAPKAEDKKGAKGAGPARTDKAREQGKK